MTEELFWNQVRDAKTTGELAGIALRDVLDTLRDGTFAFDAVSSNAPKVCDAIQSLNMTIHYHMPNNWLKMHGHPKRRRNHFLPHSWLKLHGNGRIPSYKKSKRTRT